ncbi:MAG: transposase, partial [Aeromonas sp.]
MQLLSSDSDSSDETDEEMDWSDTDTPRNIQSFCGAPGVKTFPQDSQNKEESVAAMFIGDDFFEEVVKETNRYYDQNKSKYKEPKKSSKWRNVTVIELKKIFGLTILMGYLRKNKLKDYWSTDPFIATPIFSKIMKRDRFLQILTFLHFNNNEDIGENADRLVKVQFLINYFSIKFANVYKPEQNLSLDEAMIPWKGRLLFKTYNPSKIVKFGILCRMVCESTTAYISSFKIYSGISAKLEDTIDFLLRPFRGLWHHIYMDNFYNSVNLALKLLKDKFRICGTIRMHRGLPNNLKNVILAPSETKYQRKGEVLLQIWKQKQSKPNVRMVSTIHNSNFKNTTKKDRTTGEFIKKPSCVIDYNRYMKGVDLADQYMAFYSIWRKTRKWTKRIAFYLSNYALFNSFVVYNKLNATKKIKYEKFLLNIAKSWISSDNQD